MPKFTEDERAQLDDLVKEAIYIGLRDKPAEAVKYISSRSNGKFKITSRYFKDLTEKFTGENAVHEWGAYMARIGYAADQMDMVQDIQRLTYDARRQYIEEQLRPVKVTNREKKEGKRARSEGFIMALRGQLMGLNKRKEELVHNSRAVLEYKAEVERVLAQYLSKDQTETSQKQNDSKQAQ
jgi:hypothetical protein